MRRHRTIFRALALLILIVILFQCSSDDETNEKKRTVKASGLWFGSWVRNVYQNPGKLEILNVHNDSIQFELHASSGGHESNIEGIAIATDSIVAIYSSKQENDLCKLEFRLLGDTIIVREMEDKCGSAIGVVYNGPYEKTDDLTREEEDPDNKTLFDVEIFETRIQDSIFRLLVGDKYSLFVSTTQLTSEDDDLDGFNTVVKSSAVRGLFTLNENIIMIDAANNIWAAVIDDKQRVLYFTNNNDFKNKLPKTIENWRQNFLSYPVIFSQ